VLATFPEALAVINPSPLVQRLDLSRPKPARHPDRGRPAVRAVLVGLLLVTTLLAGAAGVSAAASSAKGGAPRLTLVGPSTAAVNEPFSVDLVARGVKNLAGYETTLQFDPAAIVFGGAQQRGLGLAATGRGVEALGPVERTDGIVIGAWSCATPDCVTRGGKRAAKGPSGNVLVARLSFTAMKAGRIQIGLARVRLVDSAGRALNTKLSADSLQVSSVKSGHSRARRSFGLPTLLIDGSTRGQAPSPSATGAGRSRDVNHDGLVTHADVMEAAIGWLRAREASEICGAAAGATDVTGDGCLDVRDIQRIAGSLAAKGAKRSTTTRPSSISPATVPAGGPIVVNTTGDGVDAAPGDGICLTAAGACSLRAAIVEANLAAGPDDIRFAIAGSGVHTITIASPLPTLSDETGVTTIDGYTQAGAVANSAPLADNAQLTVELTGTTSIDGITVTSAGNVIKGLALFNLHRAIWYIGPGAHDNRVNGSFIGENAAGSIVPGVFVNMANGVSLTLGASDNVIGEATLAGRNVISGNYHNGVWLWDEGTDRNIVVNSIIGLSPDGLAVRRNVGRGVDMNAIASFTRVGGTAPLERNVISGNVSEGVEFSHNPMTNENRAINNFIGTDLTGEASPAYAANGWAGIHFEDGVTENFAIGNTVANSGCLNNAGNIAIETRSDGNVIRGNFVGISASGQPLASCLYGISLRSGATRNQIGPGNVIANNPLGMRVEGDATDQNTITRNSIHDNANGAIDLYPLGVTPNDPGDADTGPNENLNTPVISWASTTSVSGSACPGCRVELFRTNAGAGAYGGGRDYLLAVTTDASGAFNVGVAGLAQGDVITATATDSAGNTSEFGQNISVAAAQSSVTIAADTFERTQASGWGSADTGGAWTSSGGPAADYSVGGGAGTLRFTAGGQNRGQLLDGTSATDVDITVRATVGKVATGASQYIYLVLRRHGAEEYRAKLRMDASGKTMINFSRLINGSPEQEIGTYLDLPLTQAAPLVFRALITGTNPSVLRAKAWAVGSTEPADWQLVVSDASPSLQGPGSLGVRGYVGGATANAPLTMSFDNLVATTPGAGAPPPPPPPPPDPTDYANDNFARVVTDAWGRADVGGTWAVSTNSPDYDVDGGRATMFLSGANISRAAYLAGISAQNVDISFRFSSDVAPTGNGTTAYGIVRRIGGGTEYRVKVRLASNGNVYLHATKAVHSVETGFGTEVRIPNLTYVPGTDLLVRAQVTGASPTTLSIRAWRSNATEPTVWQFTTTDSTPALQVPGGVGFRGYIGSNATSAVLLSMDNFRVTAP
jgi:CSLREA domain-containing protein